MASRSQCGRSIWAGACFCVGLAAALVGVAEAELVEWAGLGREVGDASLADRYAALAADVVKFGGMVNEKMEFRDGAMYATAPIEEGELLVKVTSNFFFPGEVADVGKLAKKLAEPSGVLEEVFESYLNILPTTCQLPSMCGAALPLGILSTTPVFEELEAGRKNDLARVLQISDEQEKVALSVVMSRMLMVPEDLDNLDSHEFAAMIPLLDLFNHDSEKGLEAEFAFGVDKNILATGSLKAKQAYAEGEEIYMKYQGTEDFFDTFVRYNIVLPYPGDEAIEAAGGKDYPCAIAIQLNLEAYSGREEWREDCIANLMYVERLDYKIEEHLNFVSQITEEEDPDPVFTRGAVRWVKTQNELDAQKELEGSEPKSDAKSPPEL